VRTRASLPAGHGELTTRPALDTWPALLDANRAARAGWEFKVAGMAALELAAMARGEVLERATGFSARLGVPVRAAGGVDEPIVATGHQPELYHPGVWVKDFLLDRVAGEVGASAIDFVVDTDGFDSLGVSSPCLTPCVDRCSQYLAVGGAERTYASAKVPEADEIDRFSAAVVDAVSSLPAPAIRVHFERFARLLRESASDARDLAELVTFARRRYEASAKTGYLELPVSSMARSEAFTRFLVDIALDADRFAEVYNSELREYRELTATRSAAQPFPDLAREDGRIELPFWVMTPAARRPLFAQGAAGEVRLYAGDELVASLPAEADEAVRSLEASEVDFAPKALALTMFVRMFACDLFIHGVGGGRYDQVTDGVVRRYYGVEPPQFVVASLTMFLPLGAHAVTPEEISAAKERLNKLEHNPDVLVGEIVFDDADERLHATRLAAEKRELVGRIGVHGADKKALGARIREVNSELAEVLAPVREELEAELASLTRQAQANDILTDRTYPFCFWDPREIQDKAG
jgi:hypothetical protein